MTFALTLTLTFHPHQAAEAVVTYGIELRQRADDSQATERRLLLSRVQGRISQTNYDLCLHAARQQGQQALARSRPCGRSPLQRATPLAYSRPVSRGSALACLPACRISPIPLLSTIQAQDAGACLAAFYRQALRKATVELPVEFRQGGN